MCSSDLKADKGDLADASCALVRDRGERGITEG